jgi:SH3-like domain-containing protein
MRRADGRAEFRWRLVRWALAPWLVVASATGAPVVEFRSVGPAAAVLYDAPSLLATKVFVASPAYPLEVVVQLGKQWTKVRDVAGTFTWVESRFLSEHRTVVVTAPVAEIRERPEETAPVLFRAEKDVVLDLAETPTTAWIKVHHRDGQVGYVRLSQIWGI